MQHYSPARSSPIVLTQSTEAAVYGLFALAMGLTVIGVLIGTRYAATMLTTGVHVFFAIAELAIIFTASWWKEKTPLNYVLFVLFPTLSGITITPYILYVLVGYANGASILLNALAGTTFMTLAVAVFARTTTWNLGVIGRALFFALLGLIVMGILQLFIPSLHTGTFELMLSGAGIIVFSLFTAYDLQRIQKYAMMGASPFLLALSLYLDIFNLFLYILRFMIAVSGQRR